MSSIDMNTTDSMNKNPDFELPVEPGHGTIVGPIIPVGKLSIDRIETSDTISEFMEKVNNNFTNILIHGGGPRGVEGDQGHQGVPTKPKVPIHVWIEGENYAIENKLNEREYEIIHNEDLTNVKYQEGHLIMLQNAHVYKLENIDGNLTPKFIIALQSYDPGSIINGKNAYVHIAYADSSNGQIGFVTAQEVRGEFIEEQTTTNLNKTDISNKAYMGMCSNENQKSPNHYSAYTWVRIQGNTGATGLQGETGSQGPQGPKGDKGDKGDGYTGHPFTIDLEGDMSTISVNIYGCRQYENDYCECILHGYYGSENVNLSEVYTKIEVKLPEEYDYYDTNKTNIVHVSDRKTIIGQITKNLNGNNIIIHFKPYANFVFPKKTIIFPIHIEASITDKNDGKTYDFVRDLVWTVKGILSTFELEIQPQYRTIKLTEEGYIPNVLIVDVYKVENTERTKIIFDENGKYEDFTLLYKEYGVEGEWKTYPTYGIDTTQIATCVEIKVVRYYGSIDPEKPEEIWDNEDVWVVADGKSTHYYHADLGATESMIVLTTGEKFTIENQYGEHECAELRNSEGYSITFEPKFFDGATELNITNVGIGTNSSEKYFKNGTFVGSLKKDNSKYTLTITQVPYGVEMLPMSINVTAKDDSGNLHSDLVSFNVYITTLSNTYILVPTVSSYNTSTGKDGDTIGCSVYKNNTLIEISELEQNGLTLNYAVHDGGTDPAVIVKYTEPLIYGDDDDLEENEFTAKDVSIVFILSYGGKEIVRSIVTLVKDGIDGRDGDCWQYIFCRSPYYPFSKTGISDPSTWVNDPAPKDSSNEYLGNFEEDYNEYPNLQWYDDHKGVDSQNRYEYQAYRKWDKDKKEWSKYGSPTLYSNYSESGSGYSVLLSNPVAVIPVGDGDNDWKVDENNTNQYDSTLVYLYNNTSDISSNKNVTISLPSDIEFIRHFTITKDENGINKVTFTPVKDLINNGLITKSIFDFGSNKQYKLPITLRYDLGEDFDGDGVNDHFTSTINWTLSPIKGLEDVELFVDKRVVNVSSSSTHSLKVGYYIISSNGGKKFIEEYNDTYGYQIKLTNDIAKLPSIYVTDWQNATYDFVYNGVNRNCYVVLVDSDGETIIDYAEVIPVIDGNDGKSAIHLELTQDYIALPSNPDGITTDYGAVHPKYGKAVQATMNLYDGITLISNIKKLITYSFKINDIPLNEFISVNKIENVEDIPVDQYGGFSIPKPLILGDTNLECIATYKGASYSKTIFIDLENIPYELELNKSILTRDPNTNRITDTTLEVRVKYWMDGQWVYAPTGTVVISTPNIQETIRITSPTNNTDDKYTRIIYIQNLTFFQRAEKEIRISYIGTSGKELSYEIIGIISNGKDGQKGEDGAAPTCIKTEILGYSLDENATIPDGESDVSNKVGDGVNLSTGKNYMWQTHINKLNAEPGVTIYMLNRYTWETTIGNTKQTYTTFGITVTLAGTQGIEGKSRVLFYLGSYYEGNLDKPETPTLTDPIPTTFNDSRCDYYIDSKGVAWMRTGTATDASDPNGPQAYTIPNGPGGGSGNMYWKKSEKVGFLQAGAITADMINTGSITADSALVTTLFAEDIIAKNLKVTNANIEGKLSADKIVVGSNTEGINDVVDGIIQGTTIDGNKITTGTISADRLNIKQLVTSEAFLNNLTVDAAKITGVLKASNVIVSTETLDGKISADNIDVSELYIDKLNTKTIGKNSHVNIEENFISVYDSLGNTVCKFSDDTIDVNINSSFKDTTATKIFRGTRSNNMLSPNVNISYFKINKFDHSLPASTVTGKLMPNNSIEITSDKMKIANISNGKNVNVRYSFNAKINLVDLFKGTTGQYLTIKYKIFVNIYDSTSGSTSIIKTDTYENSVTKSNVNSNELDIYYTNNFKFTTQKQDNYYFDVKFVTSYEGSGLQTTINSHKYTLNNGYVTVEYGTGNQSAKTMIYKDGMIIQNNLNGIIICGDGILFKVGEYGIKIENSGIKYATNLEQSQQYIDANWKSLIPTT